MAHAEPQIPPLGLKPSVGMTDVKDGPARRPEGLLYLGLLDPGRLYPSLLDTSVKGSSIP